VWPARRPAGRVCRHRRPALARSADNENPLTAIAGGFRVGAPGVVEQRGIGGVSKGERLRAILVAYRPEPDDWTRSGHPVMRLAARREPQHPKVGVRPVFDAARRASVEFCRTPGVPTRSDEQRASAASNQTLAQRPRQRRGATHRRRASSMASGVDGGRPSATENRLDLPLERCPVFGQRDPARPPGSLTLTRYPPSHPRILGIAGFYILGPATASAGRVTARRPSSRRVARHPDNQGKTGLTPGCTSE